jgi:hypothetical protein
MGFYDVLWGYNVTQPTIIMSINGDEWDSITNIHQHSPTFTNINGDT